ncbi:hypothetical protein CVT25_002174 [Psilocybe cyanescens]|uniref:Uncharacterized protein n=1 Tax=Psilocybe cyanescens TaxID=93625 RepID=A0A409WZY8_PSICY|nr:hypothetical protein CVT25_002174 [Psilocybe cyanescens]
MGFGAAEGTDVEVGGAVSARGIGAPEIETDTDLPVVRGDESSVGEPCPRIFPIRKFGWNFFPRVASKGMADLCAKEADRRDQAPKIGVTTIRHLM